MYYANMAYIETKNPLFMYCDDTTIKSKKMYNVANYYIRNTMTGIKKSQDSITSNESEVIKIVNDCITEANKQSKARYDAKFEKIKSDPDLPDNKKQEKLENLKQTVFKAPTDKKMVP